MLTHKPDRRAFPAEPKARADRNRAADRTDAAGAELAAALILDGCTADHSGAPAQQIQPALVAEGWRSTGQPPDVRDGARDIAHFLRRAQAVGLLNRRRSARGRSASS